MLKYSYMCGIVGYINNNKTENEQIINQMNDAIFHRGPDGAGTFVNDHVALGMRRLAIIDVAHGDQPIWNKDKTKCIFFNGEIYNYLELRSELLPNYEFKTNSDTETILAMYEEYGIDTPKFLRGMFVFCIYDNIKNSLFIARDHFGIKPLYYFAEENKLRSFGSEIKSILKDTRYNKRVNTNAIYTYLQYQYNPLTETFFQNIYKLNPGCHMTVDLNSSVFSIFKYYDFSFSVDKNMNLSGTTEDIKILLKDSVAHHAIAEVPVGSFLSGGIDSSINATLLTKHLNKPIHTFTIGSKERGEFVAAKETSDMLGSNHHEIYVDKNEYMNVLSRAVYHFDEPVADPSAILLYMMAAEARKHVTVVLSGEGADEFFGGYTIYREYYDRRKLDVVPKLLRDNILRRLAFSNFKFFGKNYLIRYFTPLKDRYIGNAKIYTKDELEKVWAGKKVDEVFSIEYLFSKAKYYSEPMQMQYIDIHTWLIGDILAKADKMTMAHSLELRVPFLDVRVAEYAKHLPDRLKFAGHTTKYALRQAFKRLVPRSTSKRRKLGFPTALAGWLHDDITEFENKLIGGEFASSFVKKDEIAKLLSIHKAGTVDTSRKLFALYMLELWHEAFFKE